MTQLLLLLFSTVYVLSSSSFWNLWVGLEMFSFFLIPWLMEGEGKISKTNIFFYFLTQFLASVMFLMSSLSFFNELCLMVMFSSLLVKISCFPFHSWFVNIMPHVSWKKILVLTSLSKLVPLGMTILFMPPRGFIWFLIMGLLLPLGGFNTSCLRSIMAYSSVAHSSWLVICTCLGKSLSILYIMVYFLTSLPLCFYFMKETSYSMKSILKLKSEQAPFLIMILALSGIPPFLGFIPKLLAIQSLVGSGAMLEASILGILSILPIYLYFKMGILTLGLKTYLEFMFSSITVSLVLPALVGSGLLAVLLLTLSFSLSLSKTLTCQVKEMYLSNGPSDLFQVETGSMHYYKSKKYFWSGYEPLGLWCMAYLLGATSMPLWLWLT